MAPDSYRDYRDEVGEIGTEIRNPKSKILLPLFPSSHPSIRQTVKKLSDGDSNLVPSSLVPSSPPLLVSPSPHPLKPSSQSLLNPSKLSQNNIHRAHHIAYVD